MPCLFGMSFPSVQHLMIAREFPQFRDIVRSRSPPFISFEREDKRYTAEFLDPVVKLSGTRRSDDR